MAETVDVVIPSYHPEGRLIKILESLHCQTMEVRSVHLIQTGEQGLADLLAAQGLTMERFGERFPKVDLTFIGEEEFDHGATRTFGARQCTGADYCVMMTQDALPEDDTLIRRLIEPFHGDESLAVSFARQLANPDAKAVERLTRDFNYPPEPMVKCEADLPRLGIKTYFCSDVCAAYRLSVLEELGYFPEPSIFNEDMVFAGRALKAGYRIRYTAEARVFHSHSYSAVQQYRRNFDLGVSQADHPEIFAGSRSEGEGKRYVLAVLKLLSQHHALKEAPGFIAGCGMRYLGYRKGLNYRRLSRRAIRRATANPVYWKRVWRQES